MNKLLSMELKRTAIRSQIRLYYIPDNCANGEKADALQMEKHRPYVGVICCNVFIPHRSLTASFQFFAYPKCNADY